MSLYAPAAQGSQPNKPYTGFGLEQQPSQNRPQADSFLQLDGCALAAPFLARLL